MIYHKLVFITASINIANKLHSSLWILNKLQSFRLFLEDKLIILCNKKKNTVVEKCSRLSFASVCGFDFKHLKLVFGKRTKVWSWNYQLVINKLNVNIWRL